MPLLDVANELLLCISEKLESESDVNAFTRTNHRLYYLLNTYLYRRHAQKFGSTALLWAARYGREATAQRLLEQGANIQVMDSFGCTPLYIAAEAGHQAVVKLLLANDGLDVK